MEGRRNKKRKKERRKNEFKGKGGEKKNVFCWL